MGKFAYVLIAITAAMAWYLLRPEAEPEDRVAILSGVPPLIYRLHAGGLDQDIDHLTVQLHGVKRPLAVGRADAWWGLIRQIALPKDHIVPAIAEGQLGAYGLDGSRALEASTFRLRWGTSAGKGYLWEGTTSRIFVVSPLLIRQLDQLAVRFDQDALLGMEGLRHIIVTRGTHHTNLLLSNEEWYDSEHADRPLLTRRVQLLLARCKALRLTDFAGKQPTGEPDIGEMRLSQEQGPLALDQVVRIWSAAGGGFIQVDGLPAQPLDKDDVAEWLEALADLERDYVVDLARRFILSPLTEVLVSKAGAELFRLEKHGLQDTNDGLSQWDVVWPAGREVASATAASLLALTLDLLPAQGVKPGSKADRPPADALVLDFVFQLDMHHERIAIFGAPGAWQIWGPTHRGTLKDLPLLLRDLSAASMLDLKLVDRPWSQVVKIQRIRHEVDGVHGETFAVDAGGTWRQTFPAVARERQIDQLAIEQLARAACSSQAVSARFVTPQDGDILAHPDFELDLRFMPRTVKHSSDASRLDETTDQDLGFCFKREGDGWRVVNREAGVSYLLNAEVEEMLRYSVQDNLVVPLVPSLVRRIEVASPDGHYLLTEDAHGWNGQVVDADGQPGPVQVVDEVEVRRLLRRIATVRAGHIDAKAAPLAAKEVSATVVCDLPSAFTKEIVTLSIGTHRAAGDEFVLSAESTAASRHPPIGRCYLPASAAAQVAQLTPPLSSLLPAAAGRQ